MLTTLLLAAALDMPPQPPGFQPKTVQLSPKQTELKASLGSPMLKLAAPMPLAVPTGFVITNLAVQNGMVSLSWQNGTAPFQIEGRTALDAPWNTLGNSLVGWSKTFPAAQNHYWRIKGNIVLPLNLNPTNQPRLTWLPPDIMSDSLQQYTLQYRQTTPPDGQAISDDTGWSPSLTTPTPAANATSASDSTTPPVWYRLKQTTANGVVVPFTIPSLGLVAGGTCLLQRQFGGITTSPGSGIILKRGAVDSGGNLIVVGQFVYQVDCGSGPVTTNQGGQDALVAKFSPNGVCLWVKTFGNVSNDSANGVAVDSNDNIIVIGSVSGGVDAQVLDFGFGADTTFGGSDIMLVKYEPDGGVIWHKVFGGSGADTGIGVAVGPDNSIFITGTHGFFGTGANFGGGVLPTYGAQDVYVVKLTTGGNHVWSKSWGGTDSDSVANIGVDSSGNPLIGGSFRSTADFGSGAMTSGGSRDGFIAKYSGADGSAIWAKQIGGSGDDIVNDITVDSSGSVYAIMDLGPTTVINFPGKTETAMLGGSILIVKYTSDGAYSWSRAYGADISGPHGTGIGVDSNNRVTIDGEMITGIDFGSGWLLGQGGNDLFVVHFDSSGNLLWAIRGGPTGDRGDAIAINKTSGLIYAIGDCGTESDFYHLDLKAQSIIKTTGTRNNNFWATYQP